MPGDLNPPEDEAAAFTGDVPADVIRTERVFRRQFMTTLLARRACFGLAGATAFVTFFAVSVVQVRLDPVWLDPPSSALMVGAAVVAAVSAVASFVRPIPAGVRFVLGIVPGAFGMLVGATPDPPGQHWFGLTFLAGVVAAVAFVLVAGFRSRRWAVHGLARLDARRDEVADG